MNTPAHVVFSLGLLGWRNASAYAAAIAIGAIIPDLPMVFFYVYEKLRGVPEQVIWDQHYFLPQWQNIFDVVNSIPLLMTGLIVSSFLGSKTWVMVFSSSIVHCVLDFFVHHDDGHRHFYPFSDFRFASPVSYWDPQHHGYLIGSLEAVFFLVVTLCLWFLQTRMVGSHLRLTSLRWALLICAAAYGIFFLFVINTWTTLII